jgi:PAS domain-containing protein
MALFIAHLRSFSMEITPEKIKEIVDLLPGNKAVFSIHQKKLVPLFMEPETARQLGYSESEFHNLISADLLQLFVPDDHALMNGLIAEALAGKKPHGYFRIYHRDVGYAWISGSLALIGKSGADPVLLLTYQGDQDEMYLYSGVLNSTQRIILVADQTNQKILYTNPAGRAYLQRLGLPSEGLTCYQALHGEKSVCADPK